MLLDHDSGDKTSSKRCRATGSHSTSRSPHRRPLGLPRNPLECGIFQIPSDLVVKSQGTDIIDLILQLIGHSNGVHRACHHRVAYPRPADKYLGPLVSRLSGVKQPVISTRNAFSTPRLTLLACV